MIDTQIVEQYVELFVNTKPENNQASWALLGPIRHLIEQDAGYLIAIHSAVIAADPGNVIKDILGGTPTLSKLEIESYARRLMRARSYSEGRQITDKIIKPDMWMVNACMASIKEGFKSDGVVPFKLTEVS